MKNQGQQSQPMISYARCLCGRVMVFKHTKDNDLVFQCANNHIRKIPRSDVRRIPVRPPDSAA